MKKIYTYISILALSAFAAGCVEEMPSPDQDQTPGLEENAQGEISFVLSVPASSDTKTVLGAKDGSKYPVYWSPEDVVTLNGTAANAFNPSDDGTSAKATFKLASLTAPYHFLYGGVSGTTDQVTFPATQNYVADSFDPAAMPMYASIASRTDNVAFSHVGSLLRFSFTGEHQISSISLTAADETKSLSGNFTIGKSAGLLDGTLTPVSGSASLLYSFGEDKQLSSTPFVFYIAVPAGTYPGGITLEVMDNDSGHMTVKVMEDSETISAGKVREFSNVIYAPYKEANLIQIYNDATLLQFASRVAAGETTLNARVTADFTATSAWTPVEDYKGIFDGNAKTISGLTQPLFDELGGVIRNLTLNSTITATDADDRNWGMFAKVLYPSVEVDDVAGLYNCTAKGSLTFAPSSALSADSQFGGLVGNNRGGAISGCTNYATVTMVDNGQVNASQVSLGGVIGRTQKGGDLSTQGDISNCTNYGTVVCDADLSENLYIGGVLGYQVEKKESISGCVNNGLVKVGSGFSTTKALQLGGVIGIGKGLIESCTNGNEGVVTSEDGSIAGTYICQGGVVGRLNREADSYSGLSNAGKINVAASGASTGSYVGGVVGRCDEGAAISNCINTGGLIEYTGTTSTCPLHIGGIVGNTKKAVSSCTNATDILVGGEYSLNESGDYLSIGGVVGRQNSDVALTDNVNTASVTFSGVSTGYTALGGIVGYCNGAVSGGSNSGTITFSGSSNTQNFPIGGIVARTPGSKSGERVTGVTNIGKIIINTSTQTKKELFVGGVVGHLQSGELKATNNGKIEVEKIACTSFNVGGVVGKNQGGTIVAGSENLADGDIAISGLSASEYLRAGGVVGHSTGTVTGNNAGDVVTTSDATSKKSLFVGGIVGRGEASIESCINTGAVTNGCAMTTNNSYLQLGGIVGYNNGSAPLTDCHNAGAVTNTGNSAGYLYVGGVTSETDSDLSNCTNAGDVSNSGTVASGFPICVGGVAGVNGGKNFTACSSSTGEVSDNSNCTEIRVGGVIGYVYGSSAVSMEKCTNASEINISNEGEYAVGEYVEHIVAGGIAGRGNAQISYNECQNDGALCVEMYGAGNQAGVRVGGIFGDNTNTKDETTTAYDNNCTKCVNNAAVEIFLKYTENSIKIDNPVAGGIAGRMDKSTESGQTGSVLNECTNNGYIHVQSNRGVVGGIAGQMLGGKILNCSNAGKIHYRYNKSTAHYGAVGGIVANAWSAAELIDNCTNSGEIILKSLTSSSTLSNYAGGIAGWLEEDSIVVCNCENTGSVTSNTCSDNKNGAAIAGGIIGYKESSGKDYNNTNRGNVTALAVTTRAAAAGGVVGALRYGTIEACYNYGTIEAGEKVSGSNYKDENATYSVGRAGSIAGYYHTDAKTPYKACEGIITKCYVGGAVKGKHTNGELRTITADNFGGNIVGWGNDPTDCFFAGN